MLALQTIDLPLHCYLVEVGAIVIAAISCVTILYDIGVQYITT